MALNPEPAHPVERWHNGLEPKTFAEAVQEPPPPSEEVNSDSDTAIDESSIKETPPRPLNGRMDSEPRAFGEVMDEADEFEEARAQSPSLRHPKGRLEEVDGRETYAEALKGSSSPPARVNGYGGNVNGIGHVEGNTTPEMLEATGEDEAPRSPTWRTQHKRHSSRSTTPTTLTNSSPSLSPSNFVKEPSHTHLEEPSSLLYDSVTNKSGENLASLRPADSDHYLSLFPNANKPEPQPHRPRRDSELVSGRQAGAGWHRSAIRWAPFHIPLQRRLQTAVVLAHTLSIAGGLAIFFLLCTIPLLWPILLPYLLYVLISRAPISGQLSHRSDRLRRSKIWSLFASYFPARLHRSSPLEPTRKYIFGYHPHGIISHGAFAAFATEALGFSQLFPGITNTLLTLDANFRVPLYRDYALRMGLASVSRESCENLLSHGGRNGEGMGRAITIVVGGARESLDARPYSLRLVLKRRKGFVKLAIRTGADLVPVLAFGENDLYDQLNTEEHPYIHKLQMLVKKVMGFTIPLFHARGIFNYDVGMMPYRRPVDVVVGRAVKVMQADKPGLEYIDEIHGKYVEELLRLWEEWKDVFAGGRRGSLEIVE